MDIIPINKLLKSVRGRRHQQLAVPFTQLQPCKLPFHKNEPSSPLPMTSGVSPSPARSGTLAVSTRRLHIMFTSSVQSLIDTYQPVFETLRFSYGLIVVVHRLFPSDSMESRSKSSGCLDRFREMVTTDGNGRVGSDLILMTTYGPLLVKSKTNEDRWTSVPRLAVDEAWANARTATLAQSVRDSDGNRRFNDVPGCSITSDPFQRIDNQPQLGVSVRWCLDVAGVAGRIHLISSEYRLTQLLSEVLQDETHDANQDGPTTE